MSQISLRARPSVLCLLITLSLSGCAGTAPAIRSSAFPATPSALPTIVAPRATPLPVVPLSIDYMRGRDYPGSDLAIEQTLPPGSNYRRYIASYLSDGLKIFGLLTVPAGSRPATGWPVVIFNHGYIPPAQYRTTERYVAYVDAFARRGYIVFKSDYRGHGSSDGQASSAYGSPDYAVDVLNAVATLKRFPQADRDRIGMWGHSMGGNLTLRALVIDHDIKVAVIWAGVVASYRDLLENWHPPAGSGPPPSVRNSWRQAFIARFGTPEQNPAFWDSISPTAYLGDVTAPIQLDHGTADEEVPLAFSQTLADELRAAGKTVEFFTYPGDNHNISNSFSLAMQRSVAFFDRYLKG
jgi:dipeptidyl aminopeptidase/acylaminoacyl peptidase